LLEGIRRAEPDSMSQTEKEKSGKTQSLKGRTLPRVTEKIKKGSTYRTIGAKSVRRRGTSNCENLFEPKKKEKGHVFIKGGGGSRKRAGGALDTNTNQGRRKRDGTGVTKRETKS